MTKMFFAVDGLHYWDLKINSVLITRYTGQPAATQFKLTRGVAELKCARTATQKAIRWTLKPSLVTQDYGANNLSKQLATCRRDRSGTQQRETSNVISSQLYLKPNVVVVPAILNSKHSLYGIYH